MNLLEVLKINMDMTRRQVLRAGAALGFVLSTLLPFKAGKASGKKITGEEEAMNLKAPLPDGSVSVERAIKQRRTVRSFMDRPVSVQQFSQILWAGQGITQDRGFKRAAPSGGALYPMDLYASIGVNSVVGMEEGVYHYEPRDHSVQKIAEGDWRRDVAVASLNQMWMADAAMLIIVTAEYNRITIKYGKRGIRYALIESGCIGQNIFLQSQGLGLEAGIVGAFKDREVANLLGIEKTREPLIILPVGWPG